MRILGYDKSDISFDKGLTGIGFSLLYLIKNKFIDAKFEDLFSEQLEKIKETIYRLSLEDIVIDNIVDYLHVAFFFKKLNTSGLCCSIENDRIHDTIYCLLYKKCELLFNSAYEMNNNFPLEVILLSWTKLLVQSVVSRYSPDPVILEKYIHLCLHGRVKYDSVAFSCLKYLLKNTKSLLFLQYENRVKKIYNAWCDEDGICIDKNVNPDVSMCLNQYIHRIIHELNFDVEEFINKSNSISKIEYILNYYNVNNTSLLGLYNGLSKLLIYILYVINDKNSNVRLANLILLT